MPSAQRRKPPTLSRAELGAGVGAQLLWQGRPMCPAREPPGAGADGTPLFQVTRLLCGARRPVRGGRATFPGPRRTGKPAPGPRAEGLVLGNSQGLPREASGPGVTGPVLSELPFLCSQQLQGLDLSMARCDPESRKWPAQAGPTGPLTPSVVAVPVRHQQVSVRPPAQLLFEDAPCLSFFVF